MEAIRQMFQLQDKKLNLVPTDTFIRHLAEELVEVAVESAQSVSDITDEAVDVILTATLAVAAQGWTPGHLLRALEKKAAICLKSDWDVRPGQYKRIKGSETKGEKA